MDYEVELILSPELSCGEGPVWDSKKEKLYWCDSNGKSIFCYEYVTRQSVLFNEGEHAASLALHRDGSLMLCGEKGFRQITKNKKIIVYSDLTNGIYAHHLNDIIADPQGRIFSGQEVFKEGKSYKTGYLFRLDTNGDLRIVEEGLHLSNGMGFSNV